MCSANIKNPFTTIFVSLLILLAGFLFFLYIGCENESRKIENIKAFAKLYGYVRWFHPSDEAQKIDWEDLAVYGVQKVEDAPDKNALKDSLLTLFKPIAPSLKIYTLPNDEHIHTEFPMPEDTTGFNPVTWQHLGVDFGAAGNVYKSVRTNRLAGISERHFPQLLTIRQMKEELVDKKVRLSAKVKSSGKAGIFLDFIMKKDYERYFNNPNNINYRIFTKHTSWKRIEIIKEALILKDYMVFGIINKGKETVYVNDFRLEIKEGDHWRQIPVYNQSLDTLSADDKPDGYKIEDNIFYHVSSVPGKSNKAADNYVKIDYTKTDRMFDKAPRPGEFTKDTISTGVGIALPLALLGNEKYTYPRANSSATRRLKNKLADYDSHKHPYDWLGSIVISWSTLQHFFPYHDELDINWENALTTAIGEVYTASNGKEYGQVLKKMNAKLRDGHLSIKTPYERNQFFLPLYWEWKDSQLVISRVLSENLPLQRGDIIKKIEGEKARAYFSNLQQYIPAPTVGYLNYRSQLASLRGGNNEDIICSIKTAKGGEKKVTLHRTLSKGEFFRKLNYRPKIKKLKNNILYFNITRFTYDELKQHFNKMQDCNGLIFDLRGYPRFSVNFLSHLMTCPDTVKNWMRIPRIIYPNHQNQPEPKNEGWLLKPKEPQISTPKVFLADGRVISAGESIMAMIDYYDLGTIIGQPTAGTNGNVNTIDLPVGSVTFTGMKVTKLDGSQHFCKGIKPDVFVNPSFDDIRKGKDLYIEEAVRYLNNTSISK